MMPNVMTTHARRVTPAMGPEMAQGAAPERYERWFASPFGKRADQIEHQILGCLLSGIGGARSLLDVGCGTGHFAALWAANRLTAVGLDRDADMLACARSHRPWFPVMRGDALALPVQDRCVDVVAMVTVLTWLHPIAQILKPLIAPRLFLLEYVRELIK